MQSPLLRCPLFVDNAELPEEDAQEAGHQGRDGPRHRLQILHLQGTLLRMDRISGFLISDIRPDIKLDIRPVIRPTCYTSTGYPA